MNILEVSAICDLGGKRSNEDRVVVVWDLEAHTKEALHLPGPLSILCVLDGHGGWQASDFCQQRLPRMISRVFTVQKGMCSSDEEWHSSSIAFRLERAARTSVSILEREMSRKLLFATAPETSDERSKAESDPNRHTCGTTLALVLLGWSGSPEKARIAFEEGRYIQGSSLVANKDLKSIKKEDSTSSDSKMNNNYNGVNSEILEEKHGFFGPLGVEIISLNLGDSEAILVGEKGEPRTLTHLHNLTDDNERTFIHYSTVPQLQVTKALGDYTWSGGRKLWSCGSTPFLKHERILDVLELKDEAETFHALDHFYINNKHTSNINTNTNGTTRVESLNMQVQPRILAIFSDGIPDHLPGKKEEIGRRVRRLSRAGSRLALHVLVEQIIEEINRLNTDHDNLSLILCRFGPWAKPDLAVEPPQSRRPRFFNRFRIAPTATAAESGTAANSLCGQFAVAASPSHSSVAVARMSVLAGSNGSPMNLPFLNDNVLVPDTELSSATACLLDNNNNKNFFNVNNFTPGDKIYSNCCAHASKYHELLHLHNVTANNTLLNRSSVSHPIHLDQHPAFAEAIRNMSNCGNPDCPLPSPLPSPIAQLVSPLNVRITSPRSMSATSDVLLPTADFVHLPHHHQHPLDSLSSTSRSSCLATSINQVLTAAGAPRSSPPRTSTSTPLIHPMTAPHLKFLLSQQHQLQQQQQQLNNNNLVNNHLHTVTMPSSSPSTSAIHSHQGNFNNKNVNFTKQRDATEKNICLPSPLPSEPSPSFSNSNIVPRVSVYASSSLQHPQAACPPTTNLNLLNANALSPPANSIGRTSFVPTSADGSPLVPGKFLCRCAARGGRASRASRFMVTNHPSSTPPHQSQFQGACPSESSFVHDVASSQQPQSIPISTPGRRQTVHKEADNIGDLTSGVTSSRGPTGLSILLSSAVASFRKEETERRDTYVATPLMSYAASRIASPSSKSTGSENKINNNHISHDHHPDLHQDFLPIAEDEETCDICGGIKGDGSSLLLGVNKNNTSMQQQGGPIQSGESQQQINNLLSSNTIAEESSSTVFIKTLSSTSKGEKELARSSINLTGGKFANTEYYAQNAESNNRKHSSSYSSSYYSSSSSYTFSSSSYSDHRPRKLSSSSSDSNYSSSVSSSCHINNKDTFNNYNYKPFKRRDREFSRDSKPTGSDDAIHVKRDSSQLSLPLKQISRSGHDNNNVKNQSGTGASSKLNASPVASPPRQPVDFFCFESNNGCLSNPFLLNENKKENNFFNANLDENCVYCGKLKSDSECECGLAIGGNLGCLQGIYLPNGSSGMASLAPSKCNDKYIIGAEEVDLELEGGLAAVVAAAEVLLSNQAHTNTNSSNHNHSHNDKKNVDFN